jgi:hypothetical protein
MLAALVFSVSPNEDFLAKLAFQCIRLQTGGNFSFVELVKMRLLPYYSVNIHVAQLALEKLFFRVLHYNVQVHGIVSTVLLSTHHTRKVFLSSLSPMVYLEVGHFFQLQLAWLDLVF